MADIAILISLVLLIAHLGVKSVEFLLGAFFEVDVLSGFVFEHVFNGEFQVDARLEATDVALVKSTLLVMAHAPVLH